MSSGWHWHTYTSLDLVLVHSPTLLQADPQLPCREFPIILSCCSSSHPLDLTPFSNCLSSFRSYIHTYCHIYTCMYIESYSFQIGEEIRVFALSESDLFCLTVISRFIHFPKTSGSHSPLWLSEIPLYNESCFCIHQLMGLSADPVSWLSRVAQQWNAWRFWTSGSHLVLTRSRYSLSPHSIYQHPRGPASDALPTLLTDLASP